MASGSTRNGDERVLEWDLHRVAARTIEDGTPGWHDTRPLLQWSEYADWAAVATWAWPLYESSQRPSATVRAEARGIARDLPDKPEQHMLAVLRFVQSEIRYLAISIGPGSHAPNAAERVLERRFGDCKDKAQLMIAMLSALGIEARAALVDTTLQRGVRDLQPSPNAFDHVIVQVRIGDRFYWLDPTRSPQNGDAAHLQQANYGVALIVDPATGTLADMQDTPIARRTVTGVIDASAGFDQPVEYTVTTVAEGARADGLRAELAASGLDKLQQQYLNFYARYYPDIESAAPVKITEDASTNRVTTVESYRIAHYWTENGDTRQADIETPDLDEALRQPAVVVRQAPLQLVHPQELVHHTELRLPEVWSLDAETTRVEDPAFLFERSTRLDGKRILITDQFQTRMAEISGADTPRYAANLARAQQETGLRLTWRKSAARESSALQRFNWPIGLLSLMLLALWVVVAMFVYRLDPPAGGAPLDPRLQGIRGWLLLPALGTLLAPLRLLYDLRDMGAIFDASTWSLLTTYGSASYNPLWAPVVLFELAANSALLVFSLLLLLMFFQRRRAVPRLYIGVLAAGLCLRALDLWLGSLVAGDAVELRDQVEIVRDGIGAAIWSTYFLVSQRVRATFVVGWKGGNRQGAVASDPVQAT